MDASPAHRREDRLLHPLALIVADRDIDRHSAGQWAAASGAWEVATAAPVEAASWVAHRPPALALIVPDRGQQRSEPPAAAIRRAGGRGADVPLIGIGGHFPLLDGSIDELRSCSASAALRRWTPRDEAPALARLGASFGVDAIGQLLDGLHAQLSALLAMTTLDDALRGTAHRIAGLSGTLGFATLSAAWRAVSERDDAAWDDARVASRRALHAITTGRVWAAGQRPDPT